MKIVLDGFNKRVFYNMYYRFHKKVGHMGPTIYISNTNFALEMWPTFLWNR